MKIAKTKRQWQNQTFGSLEICSMSLFVYHVVESLCLPTRRQIVPGGKFAIIHGFINHLPSNIGLSLALIGNAGKIGQNNCEAYHIWIETKRNVECWGRAV